MERSIELYDQLHSFGREVAMNIEEANAEGCNFYDNEPTRLAFVDFRECFRSFCEEQNCIEGEPFAQESPTIRSFLDLHKATKRPSRRLKIGVKAPPVLSIGRQASTFRRSSAPPAPRSLAEESYKKPTATVLAQPVAEEGKLAAPMAELSLKEESFESFVKASNSSVFKDAVFFVPKGYRDEFLKNKAEYTKRHGFRGRHEVLEKLLRFRSLMRNSEWSEANGIEIVSLTGSSHKVGDITFNFSSLDDCLADRDNTPFVKMLSSAPLKR